MEAGTLERFKKGINLGGKLLYNESIVKIDDTAKEQIDCNLYGVPVTDMAQDMKAPFMANMIMLGAYREITGTLSEELVKDAMKYILTNEGKKDRLDLNVKAYDKGAEYARSQNW
jgi:2-oxoglutarate ferredoxin oxidoreductase subunit gamma